MPKKCKNASPAPPTTLPTTTDSTASEVKLDCKGNTRWADRLVAYLKDNDDFRRPSFRIPSRWPAPKTVSRLRRMAHQRRRSPIDLPFLSGTSRTWSIADYHENTKKFETSLRRFLGASIRKSSAPDVCFVGFTVSCHYRIQKKFRNSENICKPFSRVGGHYGRGGAW